jgi:hypothetical protein
MRFGKAQLATAEIQRGSPAILERPGDGRRDTVAHAFPLATALHQSGAPEDAEMVRHMRLTSPYRPHKVIDALIADQQRFKETQTGLVAQRLQDVRALQVGEGGAPHTRTSNS